MGTSPRSPVARLHPASVSRLARLPVLLLSLPKGDSGLSDSELLSGVDKNVGGQVC